MKNVILKSKRINKAFAVATLLVLPSLASAQFALPTAAIIEAVGNINDLATLTNDMGLSKDETVNLAPANTIVHKGSSINGFIDTRALVDGFDVLQGVILLSALNNSNAPVMRGVSSSH